MWSPSPKAHHNDLNVEPVSTAVRFYRDFINIVGLSYETEITCLKGKRLRPRGQPLSAYRLPQLIVTHIWVQGYRKPAVVRRYSQIAERAENKSSKQHVSEQYRWIFRGKSCLLKIIMTQPRMSHMKTSILGKREPQYSTQWVNGMGRKWNVFLQIFALKLSHYAMSF